LAAGASRSVTFLAGQDSAAGPTGATSVLDGSPGVPAANSETNTIYVPIQCAQNFCPNGGAPGTVVDLIDTATCNANTAANCQVVARAKVGNGPLAAIVDQATDTIYVSNGDGTLSVVDGAHCNIEVTTGCATPLATVNVGGIPVAGALNPATGTLYLASPPTGAVIVVDVSHCNTTTITGCSNPVKTVSDGLIPDSVAVNVATDTVYAANGGPTGKGDTLSVINGAACNAATATGCGRTPTTVLVGTNPFWDAVDPNTDTVYVANYNENLGAGSISVVNGATCNGHVTNGCDQTARAVTTGAGAAFVAVDEALHTAFTANPNDNTLSALNTQTCNAIRSSGCPRLAPAEVAAPNQGGHFIGEPGAFALMESTDSLYLVGPGGVNFLSVASVRSCNATTTVGCRVDAPSVRASDYLPAVDPATNTIYASNLTLPQIDVYNGTTCHAGRVSGCAPIGVIPFPHKQANLGALDPSTHTLYAADPFGDTVTAIDTSACNAINPLGCYNPFPTLTIGPVPGSPVLNPTTHTLYTPYGTKANKVAVDDASTCNAQNSQGCGQTPGVATVAPLNFVLGLSVTTDTVYAPSLANNSVTVINGATCNAGDHAGCAHPAATANVGPSPFPITVNDATGTVYVANTGNGDLPGSLSVIREATCNGSNTSGCSGPFPTVAIGRSPLYALTDEATDTVYVADFGGASVAVLDGSTCNASVTTGCNTPAPEQAIGSKPQALAFNPNTDTVYAFCTTAPGSISIFKGST
jgi:DNA-binding beta-propeller fold protein YncE